VGYTPRYAASVMVLNPKVNQDLGGYGGRLAAPIWHDAMLPVVTAEPPAPFPPAGMTLGPPPRPRPTPDAPRRAPPPDRAPSPDPAPPPAPAPPPPDPVPPPEEEPPEEEPPPDDGRPSDEEPPPDEAPPPDERDTG
jgi:membrane peptidoglycan carboxypeptidase